MFTLLSRLLERFQSLGEFNTAGGDEPDTREPRWNGGRYLGAQWKPIHPGRMGGLIKPWAVVVHTTDMLPHTFDPLVRAWQRDAGRGAGAHFLLGRTPEQGLVQMVDVDRNGNHAGGSPAHGWFVVDGVRVHPNRVTVGIEVHAAGHVRRHLGKWRSFSGGKPHGPELPDSEVTPSKTHKDRGWHGPTQYQLDEIKGLLTALAACPVMVKAPRFTIKPNGSPPAWAPDVRWGAMPVVGHVSLDPNRKTDPGPILSEWLRTKAGG